MKLLLAGDSTVANQPVPEPFDAGLAYCGWGQVIGNYLSEVPVENYAESGYSTLDFRHNGEYEQLKRDLQPGDYVFIQFGHNDQKHAELSAKGGYTDQLSQYVNELRTLGGIPVLVTSPARNTWIEGNYVDILAPWVAAMKDVAITHDVALLDLNKRSTDWIQTLGRKPAKRYFYPGDFTHPNHYGGHKWAAMVAAEIQNSDHPSLGQLKSQLLPQQQWPNLDGAAAAADQQSGWLSPPEQVNNFDWVKAAFGVSPDCD